MSVYELVKEDWTNVGGPMGTETTSVIFRKLYGKLDVAKVEAEKDNGEKITWERTGNRWFSGDLRSHAYHINKVKVN